MVRPPESEELLSLAHQAVDRLSQGLLGEKAAMDRERLLHVGAWCQIQEARATATSDELRAVEEIKRLEECHCIHARDLEVSLSDVEEKLQQLSSEWDTARAEVLELTEGCDVALRWSRGRRKSTTM